MAINFGKYRYIGKVDNNYSPVNKGNYTPINNEQYRYNDDYFNQLIRDNDFDGAADYASQYVLNDEEEQIKRLNYLANLRREGARYNAIMSRVSTDEEREAIKFYQNVFSDRGIDKLIGKDDNDTNKYAKAFIEAKNMIGGKNASKISLSFAPKTRKFLGIDWLAKDNQNTIDNFLDSIQMTVEDLKTAGINVRKDKDGNDVIIFDKSNSLSNFILANVNTSYGRGIGSSGLSYNNGTAVKVTGLDNNDKVLKDNKINELNSVQYINNLQRIIEETSKISDIYTQPIEGAKVYSATVGAFIEDGLEELKQQRDKGLIKQSDYNALVQERYGEIIGVLRGMGSANIQMYSDSYNDNDKDETMRLLTNEQRHFMLESLNNTDDITLNTMTFNGTIGTLVTLNSIPEDKKNINMGDKPEESIKRESYSFFIPGLFHEKAQEAINKDARTRASQQLDSMQDWGYSVKLNDGSELEHKGGYLFEYNGKPIDVNQARNLLTADYSIEDAVRAIKYQYTDVNGNINEDIARQVAQTVAYNVTNEIYSDVPFKSINLQDFDISTIFSMMNLLGNDVAEEYKQFLNLSVYKKILETYNIYNTIIEQLKKS